MSERTTVVRTTVVVVTWRSRDHIVACLDAVAGQNRPHRTIVLDNASSDGTAALVARHPSRPRVLRLPRNAGYAGGLAAALAAVDTPFVAWLNDDAQPEPGWLAELEDALDADPSVGAASARLLATDGSVQSDGLRLTGRGYGADTVTDAVTDAVTGAPGTDGSDGEVFGFCGGAALVRTDALRAVGGVPAEFFCYYEDTDTSWRLRLAEWRIVSVPAARVRHLHGASTRPGSIPFHRWNERNRLLMLLRCAPAGVAVRELARFTAITGALPVRRLLAPTLGSEVPRAANFRVGLRLRVLADVLARLPSSLRQRGRIGRIATVARTAAWARWARD